MLRLVSQEDSFGVASDVLPRGAHATTAMLEIRSGEI